MIKNFAELATTENRKLALQIMEAGLDAINTEQVIKNKIKLENNILKVGGQDFDLAKFKNIKVVGFGKSSCDAAVALENILKEKISQGAVISLNSAICGNIETFIGTHPKPSKLNVTGGDKIYQIVKDSTEEDLIIVLVSGGGSALLCYGRDECDQEIKLYDSFLKSGKTISEINTVRKHLSVLKGGGLARLAYPATVLGLIFSDVPGNHFADVASGPTYKDETTVADAEKIITENNLGDFNLVETPKEDKYFEKVYNFVLVSNKTAVEAMAKKAEEFKLAVNVVSTELYDKVDEALQKIFSSQGESKVVLAAGEPRLVVSEKNGSGGRNLQMGVEALRMGLISRENKNSVFISFASDGMDNSDAAGAVLDKSAAEQAEKLGLNISDYAARFDSYNFFRQTGDLIMTGSTGANVSDLMILLNN